MLIMSNRTTLRHVLPFSPPREFEGRTVMRMPVLAPFVAAAALMSPMAASAAETSFSGSMSGSAIVSPNAGCAPIPFQGVISGASGTSSLGSFSYSHTVCTQGPLGGPVIGTYTIDFGEDEFVGALTGTSSATATPGVFQLLLSYTITGGTGRFADATGAFNGVGTADARVRPSIVSLNFTAVPEPGTWAMMLVGFGAIGMAMRRRRSAQARLAQCA